MITDDNKKLAQWAMEYALKNGCQAAKLVLYTNSNSSFELRDGKMDRLQQSTENGLGLNLMWTDVSALFPPIGWIRKNWKLLSRMV